MKSPLPTQRDLTAGWRLAFVRRCCIWLPVACLLSCTAFYYHYDARYVLKLAQVEPSSGKIRAHTEYPDSAIYEFSDTRMHMDWTTAGARLNFVLDNLTPDTLRIHWTEVRYIDEKQNSHRVLHAGVPADQDTADEYDSIVLPREREVDYLLPLHLAVTSTTRPDAIVREEPLFSLSSQSERSARREASKLLGREVWVLMPIEVNGATIPYRFVFQIDQITVR